MITAALHNIISHPIEAILTIACMLAFDFLIRRK